MCYQPLAVGKKSLRSQDDLWSGHHWNVFFFGDVFVTFVKSTFCLNMVWIRFFWLYDLNVGDDVIDVHVMSLVCVTHVLDVFLLHSKKWGK